MKVGYVRVSTEGQNIMYPIRWTRQEEGIA